MENPKTPLKERQTSKYNTYNPNKVCGGRGISNICYIPRHFSNVSRIVDVTQGYKNVGHT